MKIHAENQLRIRMVAKSHNFRQFVSCMYRKLAYRKLVHIGCHQYATTVISILM